MRTETRISDGFDPRGRCSDMYTRLHRDIAYLAFDLEHYGVVSMALGWHTPRGRRSILKLFFPSLRIA